MHVPMTAAARRSLLPMVYVSFTALVVAAALSLLSIQYAHQVVQETYAVV